ncbi:MAG: hypothetical protein HYZ11_13590 [Candidatus Tectomicrobia bacterium]|uniref:Uncharacterized protein n=1 Tax=Tectimicrobiota bacterium TaxID=2528274 RepID=A0A932I3G5_UNCTE|nr:hypothetical protein [Candidatus Tectomicrobia bacterium]
MAPPVTCPFRICLENGEILCFDPWFVRSVSRGPHFVRDFCQGDFTACPFYQMQKIKRVHA